MARVRAGEIQLGWREWGKGDVTVVFIHGNLASKDWIELAAPLFPSGVRVIGIDWRGCGESDGRRPRPILPIIPCASMRSTCWRRLMSCEYLSVTLRLTLPEASSRRECC
jgi:pimeloyl-ACP methyl ester carboxylesterase